MGSTAIAGPRRTKQAPPPVPQPRQVAPVDLSQTQRSADARAPGARPGPMPIVTMPAKRAKPRRWRWFILGIAFGALGAVLARGDAHRTLHDLRVWSARALRSLERTAPPPPARSQPSTATPAPKPIALVVDAPCPNTPAPGDPCADLLAPFLDPPKPPVPTVSVEALPRVRAPVIARHRHHAAPAPAPAATVADDPQEPPARDEQDDLPTSQVRTAENDPPPVQ
ncbi:MAG TPA: hypothetical protein VMI75_13465 [Polyangiaceae bacterium]|nr:hypothetical protein [Polyangiaceae bacterium]